MRHPSGQTATLPTDTLKCVLQMLSYAYQIH